MTLEAVKHITLLNNPYLDDQFAEIKATLRKLTAADDQFCRNDKLFSQATSVLGNSVSTLSRALNYVVAKLNSVLPGVVSSINGTLVPGINRPLSTIVAGANASITKINKAVAELKGWDLRIDVPNPTVRIFDTDFTIPIAAFTIANALSSVLGSLEEISPIDPVSVPTIPTAVSIPLPSLVLDPIETYLSNVKCPANI